MAAASEAMKEFISQVEWEGKDESWDDEILACLEKNDVKVCPN